MTRKKRRKRHPGAAAVALLLAAGAYLIFIAATQPERFSFNRRPETAPVIAQASEEAEEETAPPFNAYETLSYYIADKQEAYAQYAAAHPDLSGGDVVWRVNAGLYRPFYTDAAVTDDPNPLLVNPYNRLPDDFTPQALEAVDEHGRAATPETVRAYERMAEGAARDGHRLRVQSAYRSITYQEGLYAREESDGAVARPAYSEHHTGRALDLGGPDGLMDENAPTAMGQWVKDHAYEYGFIVRYTTENQSVTGYMDEPWHLTYVGEAIARAMRQDGYGSLEEYAAKNPGAALPS